MGIKFQSRQTYKFRTLDRRPLMALMHRTCRPIHGHKVASVDLTADN